MNYVFIYVSRDYITHILFFIRFYNNFTEKTLNHKNIIKY